MSDHNESMSVESFTPVTIRNFNPPKVALGYDRRVVDAFLEEVAGRYERAVSEIANLRRRINAGEGNGQPAHDADAAATIAALEQELAGYRERQSAIGAALLVAQQSAESIRAKAEQDARAVRSGAESEINTIRARATAEAARIRAAAQEEADKLAAEADRIRQAAREEAERLVANARREAEQISGEATEQRSSYEREIERLKDLHESTRKDLADFLLESLQRLQDPSAEQPSPEEAS